MEPVVRPGREAQLLFELPSARALGVRGLLVEAFVRIGTQETVVDPDPDEALEATVDPAAAIVIAAAERGADALEVDAVETITPGRALVLLEDGEVERKRYIHVLGVDAASRIVHLTRPLEAPVRADSTLRGWSVSRKLTAEDTGAKGRAVALWDLVFASGESVVIAQPFVLEDARPGYTLTPDRLVRYPIARALRDPGDPRLEDAIEAAYEHVLAPDLEAAGLLVERIRSWDRLEAPHVGAVLMHLALNSTDHGAAFFERAEAWYERRLERALEGRRFWYDASGDLRPPNLRQAETGSRRGITP